MAGIVKMAQAETAGPITMAWRAAMADPTFQSDAAVDAGRQQPCTNDGTMHSWWKDGLDVRDGERRYRLDAAVTA